MTMLRRREKAAPIDGLSVPERQDRFSEVWRRISGPSPVIVDGGANQGDMIERFLVQFESPCIHGFEPIPALASYLLDKYAANPGVVIHENALGARGGIASFHIVANGVSSSILKPSSLARIYHGNRLDVKETILVTEVRLDEVLPDIAIDLLKLDLQGYELEALKGCEGLLDKIKIIMTEVEFVPLYQGQPLFAEIDIFLRQGGFRLFNLYDLYTQADGQLTAGDAVYINSRCFTA